MSERLEGAGGKFSPLVMPLPLLVSILGIAFCAWSALGNVMTLCATAGCELNHDSSLWGISLWWYGAFAFCILTILSLSGKPWLGTFAAGFCVFLDLFLVALMLVTSPCTSCLVVGLIFVLAYVAFRHSGKGLDPLPRSKLVTLWVILLIANVGVVMRDLPGTWTMAGAKDPTLSIYFSPTCPECITAVELFAKNKNAAFHPVAKLDGDFEYISNMLIAMKNGDDIVTALGKAKTPQTNSLGFFETLSLRFWLLRNKAEILISGSNYVPFIESIGLPAALKEPKPKKKPAPKPYEEPMETLESMDPINLNDDATLPIDTGETEACGGEEEKPCS